MRFQFAKKGRRWERYGLGALLAAGVITLALVLTPGLGPARERLLRLFRGEVAAPETPPRGIGLPETLDRTEDAAFNRWTAAFTGGLCPPPPRPVGRSPFRQLVDRLLSVAPGGAREPGRKWEIADVVYDPEEGKKGATVRSAWSDRFSSVCGLALRPAGIDPVLGLEYRLIDSLIFGHQREFRLDEGRPVDPGGESKVYLRWQKEF